MSKTETRTSPKLSKALNILLGDWRVCRTVANPRAHRIERIDDGRASFVCGSSDRLIYLTANVRGVPKCETCLGTPIKKQED